MLFTKSKQVEQLNAEKLVHRKVIICTVRFHTVCHACSGLTGYYITNLHDNIYLEGVN